MRNYSSRSFFLKQEEDFIDPLSIGVLLLGKDMFGRSHKLFSKIVDIKPDEVRMALLVFFFFFLITAPHTIIKALRYADLLHQMGFQALPLAYILAAVVSGLVVVLFSKIQFKIPLQTLILISLLFFIATGMIFQLFINIASNFLSLLFWVWAGVLLIVLLTLFGLTINEIFNPREAKRLIGFFGSGGILGGTAGGLVGYFLIRANLGAYLLPLACGLLFACAFIVRSIFIHHQKNQPMDTHKRIRTEAPGYVGFKESYQSVRKNRYLLLIAVMVILTVIVSTFVDYQFSYYAQERYNTEEELQKFFTLFFSSLTVFAFFFQILLTGFFLKKNKGILLTMLMVPLLLMAGSFGLLIGGLFIGQVTFMAAILIKGGEESLAFSLNQSVREILYIPVPLNVRYKARTFIDIFVKGMAKVIAAGLLFFYGLFFKVLGIGVQEVPYFSPYWDSTLAVYLSGGIIVLTFLWGILDLRIFREYIKAIQEKIKPKWVPVDSDLSGKIDISHTKKIFDTLESRQTSSVLFAMHLYDLLRQNKLSPEFRDLISERITDVKVASMADLFNAEGIGWFPEVGDQRSLEDFVADIQDILSLETYQNLIREHAEKVMEHGRDSEIEKMELAKIIGMMEAEAPLVLRLEALIGDESPRVARIALESAGKLNRQEHLPAIVKTLKSPVLREDAAAALVQFGPKALREFRQILRDDQTDLEIRKSIVSVLSRIGIQPAADILIEELKLDEGEMRRDLIEALERLRSERKGLHFEREVLMSKTIETVKVYFNDYIELYGRELEGDQRQKMKKRTLDLLFSDIFKLLGLFHLQSDIIKAHQNLKEGTKDASDYAVELLDNTLDKEVRGFIMPMIVDLTPAVRIRMFQQILDKWSAI